MFLSGPSYGYRPRSVYRIGVSLTKRRFGTTLLETGFRERIMLRCESIEHGLLSFLDQENPVVGATGGMRERLEELFGRNDV